MLKNEVCSVPWFICSVVVMLTFAADLRADDDKCQVQGGGSQKLKQCVRARCLAKHACSEKAQAAVKASNEAAAATGAQFKKNDEISKPADASSKVQAQSSQLYKDAIAECDKQQKDQCEAQCKPDGADKDDKPKIEKQLKECKEDIANLKKPLGAGGAAADEAAAGSKDTNKESNGQAAPQMPQSQDKDKDKDDSKDSSSPASTPSMPSPNPSPSSNDTQNSGSTSSAITPAAGVSPAASCAGLQAKCVNDLKIQCAKTSSDVCTNFTNRYCGKNGVTGGMEGADDIKAGSGAGDEYCTSDTAKSFCAVGGRDSCDSCRKLRNLTPLPAAEQASACGIDPATLPTLQKSGSSNAMGLSSMGGSGGSSSGGSTSAIATPVTAGANAVKENPYDKLRESMNMTADGAGGGGGGNNGGGGGGETDPGADPALPNYGIIGRVLANAAGSMQPASVNVTDIAVGGPRVFKLVEDVYLARCAAKKANNCPPRP